MISLVHETTRFSDDRYPHAFDAAEQAHVHRLASEAIESTGNFYLVDLRGEYFVFLVYADSVRDVAANERFYRLTLGTGHPDSWSRVSSNWSGDKLAGLAPSRADPAVARRILREAVILSDFIGPVCPDGNRRLVEVVGNAGTVTTSGLLGHRSMPQQLPRVLIEAAFVPPTDSEQAALQGGGTDLLGERQHPFLWRGRGWVALTRRHRESDEATGEAYFVTELVAATRDRRSSEYPQGPSSVDTREAKLSFARAFLAAQATDGDPGRAEQMLIPDETRDYATTAYELHTLATLTGAPIADSRTWAERKRDFGASR